MVRKEGIVAASSGSVARLRQSDLRDAEDVLFPLLEGIPVGIFIVRSGGRPYYANREAVRLLGRGVLPSASAEDLADAYDVWVRGTEELYPTDRLAIVEALAGRATTHDDAEIRQPDGTVVPIQIWGTPVAGPDGMAEYAITVFADASGHERAGEALRASEELFPASVEVLPDGFAVFSAIHDNTGAVASAMSTSTMQDAAWTSDPRRKRSGTPSRSCSPGR
jgi:PAS domain-containing protein